MQRRWWVWCGVVLTGAVMGCRSDGATPVVDMGDTGNAVVDVATDVSASRDVGAGLDAGGSTDAATATDAGTTHRDAGSLTTSMATLTNPAAAGHPASGTVVTLADTNLVALSPRLFISGPSTTGACAYAAWIGTSTGGDFSAVELFESLPAGVGDGGSPDCFARSVVGVIPADLAVGDTFGLVRGKVNAYCPRGSTCPTGTSLEFEVAAAGGGALSVTGHRGAVPAPTVVRVSDINGTGVTLAARDLALQNALVQINGALLRTAPSTANHDTMIVGDSSGDAGVPVSVARYRGVTCQRTLLGAAAPGFSVGTVLGILQYSFGNWSIQLRQDTDLPGVTCSGDGGVVDASVVDATAADAH